jgi:hypothetical protein
LSAGFIKKFCFSFFMSFYYNEKLAYWLGVFQSDGYLREQYVKSEKRVRFYIGLGLSKKSLPMLYKFKEISQELFGIKGCIYKDINKEGFVQYQYKFGCKNLLELFYNLELLPKKELIPPSWISSSKSFFGAYLAGVIDGDGDVRVSRPKYPQCKIRITSSGDLVDIMKLIRFHFNCKVHSVFCVKKNKLKKRYFISRSWRLEFCISKKNALDFFLYVIPFLRLDYKKKKLLLSCLKKIKLTWFDQVSFMIGRQTKT